MADEKTAAAETAAEAKPAEKPAETPVAAPAATPAAAPAAAAPAAAPAPAPAAREPRKRGKIAVIHIYSSKNDTIITATDLSGAETFGWASGGMIVKSDREEGRPYAAMQAAIKLVNQLKEKGVNPIFIKIRAPGGNRSKTPGAGAQAVVRTIARMGVRIERIEDVTPLPTDSMRKRGGRRGRRV
jgi:small subunit ribosomal protein S11